MCDPIPEPVLLALYEYERAAIRESDATLTAEYLRAELALRSALTAALNAAREAGRDEERARCVAIIEARRDGLAHVPWVASDDYTLAYCDACNELLEHLDELDSDAPNYLAGLNSSTDAPEIGA